MTRDEMLDELSVLHERFKNGMGWRDGNYEEALDKAIEILEQAEQTEPQTESLEQFRVGLEYHTDTTHFGKTKGESVTTNKIKDEPQTEEWYTFQDEQEYNARHGKE